jgi:hypothetical protein
MTEAEQFVRKIWPEASCTDQPAKVYWPGQGTRYVYVVTRGGHWSGIDGEGNTAIAAWADAANRLGRKLANLKIKSEESK